MKLLEILYISIHQNYQILNMNFDKTTLFRQ